MEHVDYKGTSFEVWFWCTCCKAIQFTSTFRITATPPSPSRDDTRRTAIQTNLSGRLPCLVLWGALSSPFPARSSPAAASNSPPRQPGDEAGVPRRATTKDKLISAKKKLLTVNLRQKMHVQTFISIGTSSCCAPTVNSIRNQMPIGKTLPSVYKEFCFTSLHITRKRKL